MRQLYWATARKIDPERAYQDQHISQKHSDKLFQKDEFPTVNFIWDPFLNSTILFNQLHSANAANSSRALESATAILVIGGGLWHARYLRDKGLQAWKEHVGYISSLLDDPRPWTPDSRRPLRLLAPVQVPLYDSLNEDRRRTLKPATIEAMNDHLLQVSTSHHLQIPFVFNRMLERQPAAYEESGLHASMNTADHMVDVILNMACNSRLAQQRGYPMDLTCCSKYATPNSSQNIILAASVSLVLVVTMAHPLSYLKSSRQPALLQSPIFKAAGILALALTYCYYADRSQLFEKSQKQFDMWEFQLYLAVPALLGLLSIRRSSPNARAEEAHTQLADQPFLSRDQTDEWKGWMQIAILAYHYAGASTVLPIYEAVRVLVAAYLFLTGFGHAIFYYKKPDYSLRRVSAVLIRLNMLSILLPYVMKTDYLFYYFAPLTTFFYIIIYLTMLIGHQRNDNIAFLVGKIILAAIIVNIAVRTPAIFETIFKSLAMIFRIHWNVKEWRFRLQLDSYIVFAGMLSGILFLQITSIRKAPISGHEHPKLFTNLIIHHLNHIRLTAIILALLLFPVFSAFAAASPNKLSYNACVPYISIFPILAFITLRNSTRLLRNYHCMAFAWVGKISLETFTLQFHIWLAADTKGLLRTGAVDRWYGKYADMLLLTVVFLWIAKRVSDATGRLTGWIVEGGGYGERGRAGENEGLLRVKSEVFGREGTDYAVEKKGLRRVTAKIRAWIAGDLKVRLTLILLILWILNWAY